MVAARDPPPPRRIRSSLVQDKSDLTFRTAARRAAVFLRPHASSGGLVLLSAIFLAGVNALEPLILKSIFDALAEGARRRC